MSEHSTCQHSDRHSPALKCGYPLPCQHHTVTLTEGLVIQPPLVILTKKQYDRLKPIAGITK